MSLRKGRQPGKPTGLQVWVPSLEAVLEDCMHPLPPLSSHAGFPLTHSHPLALMAAFLLPNLPQRLHELEKAFHGFLHTRLFCGSSLSCFSASWVIDFPLLPFGLSLKHFAYLHNMAYSHPSKVI